MKHLKTFEKYGSSLDDKRYTEEEFFNVKRDHLEEEISQEDKLLITKAMEDIGMSEDNASFYNGGVIIHLDYSVGSEEVEDSIEANMDKSGKVFVTGREDDGLYIFDNLQDFLNNLKGLTTTRPAW